MKLYICLLATLGVCNATFLSLFGGGGGGGNTKTTTYDIIAAPHGGAGHAHVGGGGHAHIAGHAAGPQVIKIILENGAAAPQYVHHSAAGYGAGQQQVYKIIEQSAPVVPVAPIAYHAAGHAQSYAAGHAQSYAAGHGYGGGHSQSQLNAILPQIIQLVLQEDAYGRGAGGGGGYGNVAAINGQLIDTFGHKGNAIIMRADQAQGAFFKSGHVVQRGTLKVMRVQQQQQQ
ncbi:glycine-rich cell wall structural protein 2, partial [Drosophila busckii]|uniref:glycine-rich cell wall structural protein 2 n=1 Tax=Drosophila busckii TaxID=30019 RepID=UPI00083ED79A